uniref:Uncharacterized protein n=1 Tax=Vespula pensylvanica TaxID=30213 RepID=A0A834P4S7_VESPE|nr:hypothetical protein H0235_007397 [Vespula pensylvanica]
MISDDGTVDEPPHTLESTDIEFYNFVLPLIRVLSSKTTTISVIEIYESFRVLRNNGVKDDLLIMTCLIPLWGDEHIKVIKRTQRETIRENRSTAENGLEWIMRTGKRRVRKETKHSNDIVRNYLLSLINLIQYSAMNDQDSMLLRNSSELNELRRRIIENLLDMPRK